MREIKFRAWDVVLKKMLPIACLYFDKSSDFVGVYTGDEENDEWTAIKSEHIKLMQYAGLKDVNGVDIYEGDIDCEDNGFKSVVCYLERYGAYCFVPVELYKHEDYAEQVNFHYGTDCYFDNVRPSKYSTIVGNIFENPELLEEN